MSAPKEKEEGCFWIVAYYGALCALISFFITAALYSYEAVQDIKALTLRIEALEAGK